MSKFLQAHSYSPSKDISHSRFTSISTEDTVKFSRASWASSKKPPSLHEKVSIPLKPLYHPTDKPLSEVADLKLKEILPSDIPPHSNPSILFYFEKACSASKKGEFLTAIKSYTHILSSEPRHFESLINIGVCYLKLKLPREAIESFDNAIQANSSSFLPYYNKALVQLSEKMYSDALICMTSAINNIKNPPDEIFKIRTYAIFKGGIVSEVIEEVNLKSQRFSLNKDKDKCTVRNISTKSYSPNVSSNKKRFANVKRLELCKIFTNPEKITLVVEDDSDFSKIRRRNLTPNIFKSTPESSPSIETKKRSTKKFIVPKLHKTPSSELNASKVSNTAYKLHKFRTNIAEIPPQDKGFFQKDISELNIKENILNDNKIIKRQQLCISELKQWIEDKLVGEVDKTISSNPAPLATTKITEQQLRYLISEYSKPQQDRDYAEIDNLLGTIPFFQQNSASLKKQLYEMCSICSFDAGESIFRQGDIGDRLYIIIKGSVTVLKSDLAFGSYEIVVNSLYDGKHFGDIALINDLKSNPLTRRTASCAASEHSYFLCIPKTSYQDLILSNLMHSIESKTKFFCALPLFKDINPSLLAPLACNIEQKSYFLNDVILSRGETPRGLYIVLSGTIVLYTQGLTVRERFGSEYANVKIRKPKPQEFVGANFSGVRIKTRRIKSCLNEYLPAEASACNTETTGGLVGKKCSKEMGTADKDSYLVKDEIPYATLQSKDYFGGRVLFAGEKAEGMQSKFMVIAKSAKVKVYVITRNVLGLLAPEVAFQMKTVVGKSHEVDCPDDIDTDELDSMFGHWQDFKKECVEQARKNKFMERNKLQFPYMR